MKKQVQDIHNEVVGTIVLAIVVAVLILFLSFAADKLCDYVIGKFDDVQTQQAPGTPTIDLDLRGTNQKSP